ncbi:E3-independent ubiquitin-conjugating enzyme E2 [Sarracenia purpurea var. burkii]
MTMTISKNVNGEIEEGDTSRRFRQFDVANDETDHYYLHWKISSKDNKTNGSDCFANASSLVHKKIMREWKLLEKNLPESIYVRVYERRIDLLRAAIIGAAGTPYHDGLFFFDIGFPPDYPTRPPLVYYRSFGLRLNPNLYANGMVCLSLLNTWFGRTSEKWNPDESSVLQVLVSIQGLVLNEEPYFNEPGAGLFGRAKKSRAYSENAFVLSCKTMVYLLRSPPKNFEDLVTSHFRERAPHILLACNAYMDGRVRVGWFTESGLASSSASINVSSNFKAMMKSWYPEMVRTFGSSGVSLGDFVEQLRVEREMPSSNPVGSVKKKKKKTRTTSKAITTKKMKKKAVSLRLSLIKKTKSGTRKVIGKLMKILGLKKLLTVSLSDVFSTFCHFKAYAENQVDVTIKVLRTDCGGRVFE